MRRQTVAAAVLIAGARTSGMATLCRRGVLAILATAMIGVESSSSATTLDGEYAISVTTQLVDPGTDTWRFTYDITNVNQSSGIGTGFNALYVQVPLSSAITNVSVPPAYTMPGSWQWWTNSGQDEGTWAVPAETLLPGNHWLEFESLDYGGPYPIGTTAELSFQASGVAPGLTQGEAYTCWQLGPVPPPYIGGHLFSGAPALYYSEYSTVLTGPVAIGGTQNATVVAGQLGKEGEAVLPSRPVLSEDDDGFAHYAAPAATGSGFRTKLSRKSHVLLACLAALKMKFLSFFNASSHDLR